MKLTFLLITIGTLTISANTFSQTEKMGGEFKDVSIREILDKIENETDYKFFYLKEQINDSRKLNFKSENLAIPDFLDLVFSEKEYKYKIFDNKIVVVTPLVVEKQEVVVKGKVTDTEGNPLPGVNVVEKGTTNGSITDLNGEYSISVNAPNAILSFSYVGFLSEEMDISGQSTIDVILIEDIQVLKEVVVIGYGTQKKVDLTGSISSISTDEVVNKPVTQTSQVLVGIASGVTVRQYTSMPGSDAASITIRGMGTFSSAGNSPLVLIDGLAASINDVDPNNIKSISVLKDAASASIYGTRAANGVILIETKRGQKGKLQVSYDNYFGWQEVTELPDFLESWEYAELLNEANKNGNKGSAYTEEEIALFKSGEDPDNYPNVPHLKNLLNTGSGFQTNHNLKFLGGDEKNSYLLSLGYLNQDGMLAKNHYDKYNFLLNFDSQILDKLKLKLNLNGYSSTMEEPRHYDGDMMHMIGYAVREAPVYAGRKSDGTYGYIDNFCPEGWMDSESFNDSRAKYFLGGIQVEWEVLKNLQLSGKAGYKYNSNVANQFLAEVQFDEYKTVSPNSLSVTSGDNSLLTLQALANYTKNIGKHHFKVLAGFSQEEFRSDWIRTSRDEFPNNLLYELSAGSESNMQSAGSASEWALRSYFGRINYDFAGKYLFEANTRYDGTSRFPEKGRWGLFPSVSAAWRVSEEFFIKDNAGWIDNLKIRASWGVLGNQNVGNYPYQNVLSLGRNYSFGGALFPGASVTTFGNSEITWEETKVTDVGVDATIFGGKLNLVIDYFDKTTSAILYDVTVSNVLGVSPSEFNAGEVENDGFEAMVDYRASIGKLKLSVAPNFSYVKNRVTKLSGDLEQDIANGLFVGEPLNAIYGFVADGLFVDENDIANYPDQPYAAEPGFIRYKDISGPEGVPDGEVNTTYDRKVIGSTFPKFSYGMKISAQYVGFDFSMLLQGAGGYMNQMGSYKAFAFYNGGQIQRWQADNRWTEDNPDPNAEYIKLTNLNAESGTIYKSTYWNRDASFLRLKNLQIGYTFSDKFIQKLKIRNLRVFFSGQNLFSFNHFYEGWDPEMVQSRNDYIPYYPITSVYTFGMNVKF